MTDFISIEMFGTIAGCAALVTLLTQVFKQYLPDKIDTKWLALIFSIIVGVCRIIYIGQFDFANITSGVINIFILLSVSIGLYEIGSSIGTELLTTTTTTTAIDDTADDNNEGGSD